MALNHSYSVWIIDDDQSIRWVLERALSSAGFTTTIFETASSALSRYKRISASERPQLILTDIRMPGISGFELLKQIKNVDSKQPVIIMTAYSDLDTTVQGYQQGAFEYLPKPFDIDEAIELVTRGCESNSQNIDNSDYSVADNEIIGDSLSIKKLYRQMAKLSAFSNNLLITGETGTGKSLVANAIHLAHNTKDSSLVSISASELTSESDLADIITAVEQRSSTTLVVKNIDTLSKQLQSFLVQAIAKDRTDKKQSSLRVISTTTTNLLELAQSSQFDLSLYHQLNEVTLTLPSLRERQGDITLLVNYYLNRFSHELNEDAMPVEDNAMDFLEQYDWPGNVRQLKNMCRSISISSEKNISLDNLPPELFQTQPSGLSASNDTDVNEWEYQLGIWAMKALAAGHRNILPEANAKLEKKLLECALQVTKGRKHEAAKLLGWGRNTLTRKLKEFY
jgi:two-component system nitrogen regulation response regulator GlnG